MTVKDLLRLAVEHLDEGDLIELYEQLKIISQAQQEANLAETPEEEVAYTLVTFPMMQKSGGMIN